MKTASTSQLIEYLQAYEKIHGVGSVTNIGTVCSGWRTTEYVLYIKDKEGKETRVEIPSIEEKTLWK